MIAISYNQAAFTKEFNRVLRHAQRPQAVLMTAGRELANQLKNWFRRRDKESPNKLSDRREHFWLQISRAVNEPEQTGYNAISVRISDPRIAQKVFGGRITAKAAGALTIPVSEAAYGRRASTFEAETGLKLILLRKKDDPNGRGGVLAAKVGGQLEVEYVLTQWVDQAADPKALPPEEELKRAILGRAQKTADRQAEN